LVPHSRHVLTVSDGTCGLYRPPSPARLRTRVHPLISFAPLQRLPFLPAPRLPAWSTFLGVRLPSSRHQPTASLQRAPWLATFPPRRFSRPRGFDPPPALRVYFTPLPRTGFSHEKLQAHRRSGSSPFRCPLVVSAALLPSVARRLHFAALRPQGLAPCESSGSVTTVISRRVGPPPHGSLLLQVLSPADVGAPSRPFRSWPSSEIRRVVSRTDLQRLADCGPGFPLSRMPTCSRFPACRVTNLR
jgi:hypothetical protein